MFETWLESDLKKLPHIVKLAGDAFSHDDEANRIGVTVTDNGDDAALSGTVTANVILPDGSTIEVDGTLDGNRAYIDLPEEAYVLTGPVEIYIKLYSGDDVTTLGACEGVILRTRTS